MCKPDPKERSQFEKCAGLKVKGEIEKSWGQQKSPGRWKKATKKQRSSGGDSSSRADPEQKSLRPCTDFIRKTNWEKKLWLIVNSGSRDKCIVGSARHPPPNSLPYRRGKPSQAKKKQNAHCSNEQHEQKKRNWGESVHNPWNQKRKAASIWQAHGQGCAEISDNGFRKPANKEARGRQLNPFKEGRYPRSKEFPSQGEGFLA